jgi:hypothetical protein
MVGGLVAANSSTILTHLNWGASYLVHDFYQRFVRKNAGEKHYVMAGRIATVILFLASSSLVFFLDSAKNAFDIILQVGAGTGLLYLVRWFWWRVNAWSEVVAMISSFVVSLILLILNRNGIPISTHIGLLITVLCTTICWVTTAYCAPETDRATLIAFYTKIRPFGPGWRRIRREAGLSDERPGASAQNIPMALLGWFAGCTMIWSALFAVGNVLYARYDLAITLSVVFAVSASAVMYVVNRLWTGNDAVAES